ncbi:NADH-quinone oxidoreductase subunit K [Vreelandella nanhaiensis]|uniref:NADH-quinone oxidoreductase subunit K n=1 Tax=Vreelandella nanhaiensis TaxID=1258546 RepID=UPI001FE5167A|nr:NADH-quinone oxidoreductase subunit K [Halomonas nanhaiensis]
MITFFDGVEVGLALCMVTAALFCLFDRHLLRACCFFVGFALCMALAWLILEAPWLAGVEGLIGALLTAPCLFYALGSFSHAAKLPPYDHIREPLSRGVIRTLLALAWCLMVGATVRFIFPEMVYSPTEHPLLLAGIVMIATAMGAFAWHRHLVRRLLAFNVMGSGVFLLLAGLAGTNAQGQALITVGLVVAWLGSLLGALVIRRLYQLEGQIALSGESALKEKGK